MNRTGTGPAIGIKAATRHNAMAAGSNHLLKLHRLRGPRGRLGLEADHAVLDPRPRAGLLDLRPGPPAKAVGIAAQRVDRELLEMGTRARGDEQVEVGAPCSAQAGLTRRGGSRMT